MKNSRSISTSILIGYTLIFLFSAVIVFTICAFKNDSKSKDLEVLDRKDTYTLIYQEVETPDGKWMYRISKVEFEGHTYIVLEDNGSCLLHDPDCKCQNLK